MDIKALAQEAAPYIVDRRHYYHQHPELTCEEKETRAHIHQDLVDMGITDIRDMKTCYGLVATIHGGKPGKTIGLRTDTDALSFQEETGLPFASCEPGKMHACGHDAHTAMLIATAVMLKNHEDELKGKVKLIFQPAEEGPGGAEPMVKDGVIDDVDAILALHVGTMFGPFNNGDICVSYSNTTAADDQVLINITGFGGHGSVPHECIDPVAIAALIINNIQYIISREVAPAESAVITLASVEAGRGAYNIIPETAVVKGTIRNGSPVVREFVLKRIEEIATSTARMMRGNCTVQILDGYPALVNDRSVVESFLKSARKLIPEEEIHIASHGMMGGEDAAFFFQEIPGCYFFLTNGAACPADGKQYGAHHPKFCLDEDVFYRGPALFTQAAMDWLEDNR